MRAGFDTDGGFAANGALGLIVLATDETLEPEMRRMIPDSAPLYHSRIPSAPTVTKETLAAMAGEMTASAALLPASVLRAVGYGCTSGATVIGPERVASLVGAALPGVPVTEPLSAVIAGLRALGARRLGFLTPYRPEVSAAMRAALEAAGIEIAAFASFEEEREATVARIAEASTLEAALRLAAAPGVEAVFASCTNLRTLGIVEVMEAESGRPFLSSNLALGWRMLSLAGLRPGSGAPGRLMRGLRAG